MGCNLPKNCSCEQKQRDKEHEQREKMKAHDCKSDGANESEHRKAPPWDAQPADADYYQQGNGDCADDEVDAVEARRRTKPGITGKRASND